MRRKGTLWSCVATSSWLLVACGASAPPPKEPDPIELVSRPPASPAVLRGERLLSEGQVEAARAVFQDAIADNSEDARAWLDLGLAQEAGGDVASAERAYRRATEIDSAFAEAFNNLGVLLRESGRLGQALAALERAIALDPALAAARFNLGLAYEDEGQLVEAERQYRAVIEQLPDDPVPRINLALMLLRMNRASEAAIELRAARPMVRNDVLLSIAVGEGLRRAGLPADAISVLETALRQAAEPPPTDLLAELALAYYASGDLDSAEAEMRRAVSQDERDPALQYAYGSILAKRGELGKARAHLRRAERLDPDGPYAQRARARLEALK